ncbi:hypothetical protein, partial [Actinomadura citrea]
MGEDEPGVVPGIACDQPFLILPGPVRGQLLDGVLVECDLPFSGFGLGTALFSATPDLGDLPPDPDGALVQVDVGPPQPARFTAPQPAERD